MEMKYLVFYQLHFFFVTSFFLMIFLSVSIDCKPVRRTNRQNQSVNPYCIQDK